MSALDVSICARIMNRLVDRALAAEKPSHWVSCYLHASSLGNAEAIAKAEPAPAAASQNGRGS